MTKTSLNNSLLIKLDEIQPDRELLMDINGINKIKIKCDVQAIACFLLVFAPMNPSHNPAKELNQEIIKSITISTAEVLQRRY